MARTDTSLSKARLPHALTGAIVVICVLPFVLNLAGLDFGTPPHPFDVFATSKTASETPVDAMHRTLTESFTHTLLEWGAFCTALFTVLLAFSRFTIKHDIITPIIGIALFCAGMMDAFHVLAADRLIGVVADGRNFMPFTWAAGRFFNALITIVGMGVFLAMRTSTWRERPAFVLLMSAIFGGIAYGIIRASASSAHLPQTLFPDAIVTRPYDALPLLLFLFAGTFVYPRLYRMAPSLFSHALIISTIPNVAVQLHMAFGSTALFDNHFNIAHFLKIIAYLVPFSGLALDYVRTSKEEAVAMQRLTEAQEDLLERTEQLERANADLLLRNDELDAFNYVASHDLQEPVRKMIAFSDHLRKDLGIDLSARAEQDVDFIVDAATRMQALIQDLLVLSRAGRMAMKYERLSLNVPVDHALETLAVRVQETHARITRDPLPEVWGDPLLLTQLYQNLIDNALKFVDNRPPVIRLTAERHEGRWVFGVQDHGIGMKPEYVQQIFTPFKRLHSRAEYAGTGIGLAICRKAVERHGGVIWVETTPGNGAHFKFTLATDMPVTERIAHGRD